jgi:hypothetical protein
MDKTTTIGVFNNRIDAEGAIIELQRIGVSDDDISYLSLADNENIVHTARGGSVSYGVGRGAAAGVTTGAVIGAIAGLAVANGILPGLGTLFVAGPVAAGLGLTGAAATATAGAMTGAAAGGLIGALGGLGISNKDIKIYEERVRQGDILVIVNSYSGEDIRAAFEKFDAEEVRTYSRAGQ